MNSDNWQMWLTIILSAYSYYFMKKVKDNTKVDGPLTKGEKFQVIVLMLINTLFSWAIFRFGWNEKLPKKAAQVGKYLRNIILALLIPAIVAIVVTLILVISS